MLWLKIKILNHKLRECDEKTKDYGKVLDAYQKIVKSYVDIVKVQHYTPGDLINSSKEDCFTSLLSKIQAGGELDENDKVALQQFKELLDHTSKIAIGLRKKKRS